MFSMAYSKPHSARKRMISNVYSKSYVQSSPELHEISKTMLYDRLLPLLDEAVINRKPLDVLELNYSSTMDFINAFMFGVQNGSNFLQDIETRRHWLHVYQSRRPFRFWSGELPGLKSFLARLGFDIVPKWAKGANKEIEDWTIERCIAAENSSKTLPAPNSPKDNGNLETPPIVYNQLSTSLTASSLNSPSPYPQKLAIATELLDHLAAGHETSGITLTYLFHELSLHPSLQKELRTEFLTLSPPLKFPLPASKTTLPNPRSVDALPLLHAVLMETLRIHAAIPGPQPRITPSTPTSLAGSPPLPGGVRVSAQAYTLHRNAGVFPEPEKWKPERWIETSEEKKSEMGRWFWAFGSKLFL